jgi:Ca-activated chloride channel homolog
MTIAEKGNGIYQLYNNTDEVVAKLDAQLNTMDQRTVTEDSLVNYESFFQYFLLLSLLLLVIEMLISERVIVSKRKKIPVKLAALLPTVAIGAICLLPIASSAQEDKKIIKRGNEAYQKNEFDKAAEEYKKVTAKTPANATAQYNLGNALYKSNKADEAVEAYDNAAGNLNVKDEKGKAFYNKGVVLQNNKKIPECIAAYKNALKLNPQDEDARQNLQKALQQQKQQEQKDKKKPKEDQKKEQKKQEEKQPQPQPSRITKKDAEEKLKALLQQEKNLQDKLRKVNVASPDKPEKDW